MKVKPSILLLLCSTDGSHSFSPHLPHKRSALASISRRHGSSGTRLFYDQYDGNPYGYDPDAFLSNGSPYLHHVSNLRGGDTYSNNSKEYGSLNSLSVAELKRLLNDRSIDYRDCLEKRDLIERILTSPACSTSHDTEGLSSEENRVVNTFTRASPSVAYIQTVVGGTRNGFSLKGELEAD